MGDTLSGVPPRPLIYGPPTAFLVASTGLARQARSKRVSPTGLGGSIPSATAILESSTGLACQAALKVVGPQGLVGSIPALSAKTVKGLSRPRPERG